MENQQMGLPGMADNEMLEKRRIAEILISRAIRRLAEEDVCACGHEFFDVAPVDEVYERVRWRPSDDDWLLADRPEGTVLPPPSGRKNVRTPNLYSANPSFAALLILYVRDKFNGDAPAVYRAANISRKTYSAIVSNELRVISKDTAIAFALALQLTNDEAKDLLRAAGYAFSDFLLEDIIVETCITTEIYDIATVNEILSKYGAKTLS